MKNVLLITLVALILSGCFFRPHKMDIEQGNIIVQKDVNRLRKGMSPEEVKALMGNPVFVNALTPGRLDYVYTYQPGYGERLNKRVTCLFRRGQLEDIVYL